MKLFKSLLVGGLLLSMSQPLFAEADQSLYDQAFQCFKYQKYKQANQLIDQFIEQDPSNVYGHEAKGMILDKMKEYRKAIAQFRMVLEASPKNDRSADSYGAVLQKEVLRLVKEGKADEAVNISQEAADFMPKYAAVSKGRAAVYYACAIAYFERWCTSFDDQDYLHFMFYMRETRQLDPISPTGETVTGISAYNDGDYKRALTHFQYAKRLRPSNPCTSIWNGVAYYGLGSYDSALKEFQFAQKFFACNPMLQASIADTMERLGRLEEAKLAYSSALAAKPDDERLFYAIDNLYLANGLSGELISIYREMLGSSPSFLSAYHMGLVLQQLGDREGATAAFQQAESLSSMPMQRLRARLERAVMALEVDPTVANPGQFSDSEKQLLADSNDPLYQLFLSYTAPVAQREVYARRVLRNTAPNMRWLHARAFKSLALIKRNDKLPVWATELTRQYGMRLPRESALAQSVVTQFNSDKLEALSYLQRAMAKAPSGDPAKAQGYLQSLQAQSQALNGADFGEFGTLILPQPGVFEGQLTVVPAVTDPSLANLAATHQEGVRWFYCGAKPEVPAAE